MMQPHTGTPLARTVSQLSRDAHDGLHYSPRYGLQTWRRSAESTIKRANEYELAGELPNAYVLMARAAILLLEKMPKHPEYKDHLDTFEKQLLKTQGEECLSHLAQLKSHMENPSRSTPEVRQPTLWEQAQEQERQRQQQRLNMEAADFDLARRIATEQEQRERGQHRLDPSMPLSNGQSLSQPPIHSPVPKPASQSSPRGFRQLPSIPKPRQTPPPQNVENTVIPSKLHQPPQGDIDQRRPSLPEAQLVSQPPPMSMPDPRDYRYRMQRTARHDMGNLGSHAEQPMSSTPPPDRHARSTSGPPAATHGPTFKSDHRHRHHLSSTQGWTSGMPEATIPPGLNPGQTIPPTIALSPPHPHPSTLLPNMGRVASIYHFHDVHRQPLPGSSPGPSYRPPPAPRILIPEDRLRHMKRLRPMSVPESLIPTFEKVAARHTKKGIEMCGLLLGHVKTKSNGGGPTSQPSQRYHPQDTESAWQPLNYDPTFQGEPEEELIVKALLIPKQEGTANTCSMRGEEGLVKVQMERGLIALGWIHTHPTQDCFMSSLDLHTHSAYQQTLPEAIAIVCAPKSRPSYGVFRLTEPGGLGMIMTCKRPEKFHEHPDVPGGVYTDADKRGHVTIAPDQTLGKSKRIEVIDLR